MEKIYRIFSAKVAQQLIQIGYSYVGTEVNKKYPRYTVWLFDRTEQFMKDYELIRERLDYLYVYGFIIGNFACMWGALTIEKEK